MKKIELLYFTVAKNCVNCSTADAFRAIDPDSLLLRLYNKG
jgi:hypothetical protein